MSKDFWDKRYSEKEFAYGTEPNQFFKQQIDKHKPGKILLPGEGEGRNAVYAAKLGWQVDAIDFSSSAKEKAMILANENDVDINYTVVDLEKYKFPKNYYDLVALFFLHLPLKTIKQIIQRAHNSLKINSRIIFEAFSKEQINNSSGGPKNIELLYSLDDIKKISGNFNIELLEADSISLDEGSYHKGKADVIRFVGVKW